MIVTVHNEKGGVGKTTVSGCITAWLAQKYRTLLLDTSSQAHATRMFGLEKSPGLYDLLVRNARWQDVLKVIAPERYVIPGEPGAGVGRLMIVPGNLETRNIPSSISDAGLLLRRLRQVLETRIADVVVIDTAPEPTLLHTAICIATDLLLYVTQLEEFSIESLMESKAYVDNFASFRQQSGLAPVGILGIVPNMYRKNVAEHEENLKRLKAKFGDQVMKPIHISTIWAEATSAHKPVFTYAPNTSAAKQAKALGLAIEKELLRVASSP